MKLLFEKARKHLDSQNETYFEHMWAAWKIIYLLKTLELKCLVHSVLPFLYTGAVSTELECLKKMVRRKKYETPV